MPIDARREPRIIAFLLAEAVGQRRYERHGAEAGLRDSAQLLNEVFAPALMEPFAVAATGELQGALVDPAQTPLCVSMLRESLAPWQLRVGVGIEALETGGGDPGRDPALLARSALEAARRQRGVIRYVGTGTAGDLLINAVCRLVDPLVMERTAQQWEAIAAYRRLGHQGTVAVDLGVTRQSVGDRLSAGHRREVEEADAAVAAYLTYVRRP